jgi:hypothetical protein
LSILLFTGEYATTVTALALKTGALVAVKVVQATRFGRSAVENRQRGHVAGFDSSDLANILRVAARFPVFALFIAGTALTIITLKHTAQDLPSRLANIVSTPGSQPEGNDLEAATHAGIRTWFGNRIPRV